MLLLLQGSEGEFRSQQCVVEVRSDEESGSQWNFLDVSSGHFLYSVDEDARP